MNFRQSSSYRVTASAVILLSVFLSACGGGASPESAAGTTNRAPVAVDDIALQNGGALNISVLANDRDPDGDGLRIDSVSSAANGTTAINDSGTPDSTDDFVTYTPNGGYGGNDSFTYTISDPFGLSATATVSILATSTAPVANSDDANTAADTLVSIFVLANDSDPNGLTLDLVSVTAPANGVATINNNGTPADASDDYVDYGPNSGFSGSDTFSYTVNNGAESASASVNVIVGGTGSEGVSGDVTKGPISGSVIKLYRINDQGMPVGAPVAQTATNAQGRWTVAVPLPREPLLVVSEGGQYIDETDSNPDISQRRVIQLNAADQLEAVMPAADDYLSLNLYTNAMLLKSRKETAGNEFSQVYAANRSLLTQATGFDPITTAPTDPGNPNPAASEASKQYALLLGGAANALNAVIQPTSQNAVAFNVLGGFITDMQDCRLNGINQDGPAQYLFLGAQRNMPSDINLNLEITRFRNNNFARFGGVSASLDQDFCSQSGAVPDTIAPVITLLGDNPLTFEGGGTYSDAGFTAADDRDGDVTGNVTVTGSINPTSVGSQTLTFSVTDAAGNVGTATRSVNVVDTTPPVLTLNGTTPVTVLIDTSYTDSLGANAIDAVDGDLTGSIVSVNSVDISTAGSYTITYDVTDAAGNSASQITRVVNVVDTVNPVITINGDSPLTIEVGSTYSDAGATANDAPDGDISANIVTVSNVNTAVLGSYTVTYDVTDSSGNAAMQEVRIVNVVDSTAPVIALNGADPQFIEAPAAYTELGATASDSFEGDISADIVIDASAVDTSTPGSYVVSYDVSDASGNPAIQVSRTVIVQDTTPPVITLLGANPQTVEAATAYAELGASASDTLDGNLSGALVIDTTAVDPGTPGSYLVTYDVMDAAGNAAAQVTRTVNVVDSTPPVITLNGVDPMVHEAVTPFSDPGATASDSLDGDLTASISVGGAVDVNVPGSYVLTYDVSDAAGNAAVQVTRTVNVQDTTPPIITLTGANPLTHEAATPFSDPGATASDTLDGDLTATVTFGGSVSVNAPGSYILTYDVSDAAGNAAVQVTRTVNVVDTTPPVLVVNGADPIFVIQDSVYSDTGASASDSLDGDLTGAVVIDDSAVDTSTLGTYVVNFSVTDAAGNNANATRTVKVRSATGFVASTDPADGSTFVPIDADVTIIFSQAMNAATINSSNLILSADSAGTLPVANVLSWNAGTLTATLNPDSDLGRNTQYWIIVESTVENSALEQQGIRVVFRFLTDPNFPDSDGDGVNDNDEATLASGPYPCLDPMLPDSDGDGLVDGLEIRAKSNPCVDDPTQLITYVDDDGPSAEWPGAVPLPAAPAQGSIDKPHLVLIAEGTYPTNINLSGSCDYISYVGSLNPADPLQAPMQLPDGSPATVIDMNGLPLGSEVDACSEVSFLNVHFTNGVGVPAGGGTGGGGIRASGSTTVLFDGVWMSNGSVDDQGGGLGISSGGTVATVRNSTFINNFVSAGKGGGGVWIGNGATLDMTGSRVLNNRADAQGAGIYADPGSTVAITDSTISGNRTTGPVDSGGGIHVLGPASFTISDSILSGNNGRNNGGGISIENGVAGNQILNVLFVNNYAQDDGGAIALLADSGTEVRNVTSGYNQSGGNAGAVFVTGTANVQDSIFWQSRGNDMPLSIPAAFSDVFNVAAPSWSSFNVVASPDANTGNNDIDISVGTAGFENGFYLLQELNPATSPAFDSGSGAVPGFAGLDLDIKLTSKSGVVDSGTLDRGYHYLMPSAGTPDSVAVLAPIAPAGLAALSPTPQTVVVEPLAGLRVLGRGQEVLFRIQSAPAGLALLPIANLEPLGANSAAGTDLGDGSYQLLVDTSTSGTGTLLLEVFVNGVDLGTVSIDIL